MDIGVTSLPDPKTPLREEPFTARLGHYLLSVPERLVRSATGLATGLLREVGDVAVPLSVRRTKLYQNMVESTMRFLIEQVAQVEGAYDCDKDGTLAENFAMRRAAGNGVELVGILLFRASPVWVMAALADLSGAGRHLIREIASELKKDGLLEEGSNFETMDQLLDGLERSAGHLADSINTPPLDIPALRADWQAIQKNWTSVPAPAIESLERLWSDLRREAETQQRSVLELSALLALSAVRSLPGSVVWLSRGAVLAARRTGQILGESLLGHYRKTLGEIHNTGFLAYWICEYRPYLRAAALQFSPKRRTLTDRLLGRPVIDPE
jgi:hypothetical protein